MACRVRAVLVDSRVVEDRVAEPFVLARAANDNIHIAGSTAETGKTIDNAAYAYSPPATGTTAYATANALNQYPSVAGYPYSWWPEGGLKQTDALQANYDELGKLTLAYITETPGTVDTNNFEFMGPDALDHIYFHGRQTVAHQTFPFIYHATDGLRPETILEAQCTQMLNVPPTCQGTRRYVLGPDPDERWAFLDDMNGTIKGVHTDREGTTIALSNNAEAVLKFPYDAYGQSPVPATDVGPNDYAFLYRYTGQRLDPNTGLYDYKARDYSPALGRFFQNDPAGVDQGPNLYLYAGDDPVDRGDPSGLAGCTPSTGTRICTAAQETQAKAVADVKAVRAGLKNLVTERAAVASGKQAALSPSATALEASVQKHFGNSSNDAINGRIDPMLAGVEKVLSDSGSHYNFQEADIGVHTLGRASIFGSTIKIGNTFLNASARDQEVTEIHESAHKVGANFMIPELYERNAINSTIFSPFALQNADNYGLFVYDSTHP